MILAHFSLAQKELFKYISQRPKQPANTLSFISQSTNIKLKLAQFVATNSVSSLQLNRLQTEVLEVTKIKALNKQNLFYPILNSNNLFRRPNKPKEVDLGLTEQTKNHSHSTKTIYTSLDEIHTLWTKLQEVITATSTSTLTHNTVIKLL